MIEEKETADKIVEIISVPKNDDEWAKVTFSLNNEFTALYKKDTEKRKPRRNGFLIFIRLSN